MLVLEAALAAWRLSHLLTRETGPGRIFEKLRERTGIEHDSDGYIAVIKNDWTPLSCIWCVSVWAAPFVLLITPLRRVLAVSAIVVIVESIIDEFSKLN